MDWWTVWQLAPFSLSQHPNMPQVLKHDVEFWVSCNKREFEEQSSAMILCSLTCTLCLTVSLLFFLLYVFGKQPHSQPSPPLPSLLCFLPQESTYPTAWHWTLQGRAGKEQLQALALQSSVSACTLFSSVHCLMSHASHVRCWARLFQQAVDPCALHTGDPTF